MNAALTSIKSIPITELLKKKLPETGSLPGRLLCAQKTSKFIKKHIQK
jgi:hypothetical protein